MKTSRAFSIALIAALLCTTFIHPAQAQNPIKESSRTDNQTPAGGETQLTNLLAQARPNRRAGFSLMPSHSATASALLFNITPAAVAPNLPVTGSGTLGRLTKWTGFTSSNSVIGSSTIFEDKDGNVGIGTDSPTSRLTVVGVIAATGGFKFPAGAHDATLKGDGTTANPLGVAVPLILTGATSFPTIFATNNSGNGAGVEGFAPTGYGIKGTSTSGYGVFGDSSQGFGVYGISFTGTGVYGASNNLDGVRGFSLNKNGVAGESQDSTGVSGESMTGTGIIGTSITGVGIVGKSTSSRGMQGESQDDTGVFGQSQNGPGVNGTSQNNSGVAGSSFTKEGVFGLSFGDDGVRGLASGPANRAAIAGLSSGIAGGAIAGRFLGTVRIDNQVLTGSTQAGDLIVAGKLQVTSGMKMFHIDHPLDPENKYLNHAAIESSEVLNVYSGNVITNENGDAVVTLPNWFEALNSDFRYQLTVVGTFAQAIVADEIKNNRFAIKTNAANVKVSWQVTGVRSDPTARKFKFDIEEEKSRNERGFYLNPDAFGQSEEKSIQWARDPEGMKQLKQQHTELEQLRKQQKPKQ